MQEILFRGKRIDNGEWMEGYYAQVERKHYIIEVVCENVINWHRVFPETVGQYTGLKDKDGKMIFEGDIVHIWIEDDNEFDPIKKYRAIVEFGNPNGEYNWGFQLKMIDAMSFNEDILLWIEMEESGAWCEVSGNIHDHHQLLKEG